MTQLNIWHILFYLAIIPAGVYSIEWIPHLHLNPTPGFWEVQKQILEFHQQIGNGPDIHPYCSAWYTWPLMIRPVAFFRRTAQTATEPLPVMGPPLPESAAKVIYHVFAMGNPVLWWISTAAILFLLWMLTQKIWIWVSPSQRFKTSSFGGSLQMADTWTALYLILNWLANLLPWVRITRCTFLYHYMGASVFAELAIAWLVDRWLHDYRPQRRVLGVTLIFFILLAFVFWMPIYLGLPLSLEGHRMRIITNS